MIIIFSILVILIYVAISLITKKNIETKIKKYKNETLWKEGVVDNSVVAKLVNDKNEFALIGSIGWPMYYLFCMGASLGSDIYDLLIGDNYENRIATWFI
jgi:hypothetical protein